jgi:hypothetical protein
VKLPAAGYVSIAALALALHGCASEDERLLLAPTTTLEIPANHPSRSFQLGMSSLPPELTEAAYKRTFDLIGSAADVVLIQRTPPWTEMISGELSNATIGTTQQEVEMAAQHGLDIFFAIDPTDPASGRRSLAALSPDLTGSRFGDEPIQNAMLTYARYVAANYKPRYLAFGVEINSYQRAQPEDFEHFVRLYHLAYQAVKELSPETMVFPTFQLEEWNALLPGDRRLPQLYLLNRFEPYIDAFAVSSYPRSAFVDEVPDEYYENIAGQVEKPLIIAGTGYPAGAEPEAQREQARFLEDLLEDAEALDMPLVVWFLSQDPAFGGDAAVEQLVDLGLRQADGQPKEAWRIWRLAAARTYVAAE